MKMDGSFQGSNDQIMADQQLQVENSASTDRSPGLVMEADDPSSQVVSPTMVDNQLPFSTSHDFSSAPRTEVSDGMASSSTVSRDGFPWKFQSGLLSSLCTLSFPRLKLD